MRDFIVNLIQKTIHNHISQYFTKSIWKIPIVGFANADDNNFVALKEAVSPSHLLPFDVLSTARTVIVYFIPFTREIINSNNFDDRSSKDWALAYIETNNLIDQINCELNVKLKEMNFDCSIIPPTHNFDEELLISNWSHKHVGYIAGLGRFGLHKMLITDSGCCGRIGSLITSAKIEPSKRISDEYCLYYNNQSCTKCIEKCTFEALKLDYFDRKKCYDICLRNAEDFKNLGLADVCGKCACGVPCSFINPLSSKK